MRKSLIQTQTSLPRYCESLMYVTACHMSDPELLTLCFKKVWKLCEVFNVCPDTGEASWVGALFPFLSVVTGFFLQSSAKILEFWGVAGGFVMGCAKRSWF